MLELNTVSKRYKKQTVLSELTHNFEPEVTVITGPSGAGKSTLLRLCATAEKPTKGDLVWNGKSIVKRPKPFRQGLGYAPQIVDFPEDITALDFMIHIGALKGLDHKKTTTQSKEVFERLGLLTDLDKPIRSYSGGMRRRLTLAQSLLGSPTCLVLDEPTAELDDETARSVNDLIFSYESQAVILMTTHLASHLEGRAFETFTIKPLEQL